MAKRPHNALKAQTIEKIIDSYQLGFSSIAIAKQLGVSITTVCRYLRVHNIELHRPSLRNRLSIDQEKQIVRLYLSGLTMSQVAAQVSTSYTTVFNCLTRHNIQSRSPHSYRERGTFDETFFDSIDSEEKAYFLGFLYADGCLLPDKNHSIRINLHAKDKEILERFKELLHSTYPLYAFRTLNQFCLQVSSEHMWNRLKELGCIPRKTLKLTYPRWLRSDLQKHFIRGYFDGDGTLGMYPQSSDLRRNQKVSPKIAASLLGTKKFCSGLAAVLTRDTGIRPTIYRTDKGNGVVCKLGVGGPRLTLKWMRYLYDDATIYLSRKHARYEQIRAYCIEVDERNSARPKICSRCANKVLARGFCRRHYEEWKATSKDRPTCQECSRGVYARGLCSIHYSQWRHHGLDRAQCQICNQPAIALGFCQRHYKQCRTE